MQIINNGLARTAVLAGAFLAGAPSVGSATPASPDKGTGCGMVDANGQFYYSAACTTHEVLKLDRAGNVQFLVYQDAGQLPEGAALPSSTIINRYEQCFNVGSLEIICGTVVETIMPSGVYKSSFQYH